MMQYKQLMLFPFDNKMDNGETNHTSQENVIDTNISERIAKEFATQNLPFLGCDFDIVYPQIRDLLPKETISFEIFGKDSAIMCEIICAAICHQINWDYLRKRIFEKTKNTPEWLFFDNLASISEEEIYQMLCTYDKKERIRASERADIIKKIGVWANNFTNISEVFLKNETLLDYKNIHNNLLSCSAFSGDPQEKKLQLLLQKLSSFDKLNGLSIYYRPTIDYHLIRSYLRRGLIYGKTKFAREYVKNNSATRTEKTVAAVRMHCSDMIEAISIYTNLDINIVNLIEWHIGRSVCTQEKADCKLEAKSSYWLKTKFEVCPFYNTCLARCFNQNFLNVKEPKYNGSSY